MKATIGRIVTYRSRTGNYDLPAIITATRESLFPEGVRHGDVPDLTDEGHVHLHVFTPGAQRHYQEFDVPHEPYPNAGPRTWRWPERIPGPPNPPDSPADRPIA